jgi:PilZ domain-containing protein
METALQTTAAQAVDRRGESRSPCALPTVLVVAGRSVPAIAVDVSISGACIECAHPLEEGDRISLRVATRASAIAIDAEVRWVTWDKARVRAGVRFDGMRARDMLAWIRFVVSLQDRSFE